MTRIHNVIPGHKDKLYDGPTFTGWTRTPPADLGDFDEALLVLMNQGAQSLDYTIEVCCDINDADWYEIIHQTTLIAASGIFESLQYPWGAVRFAFRSSASGVPTSMVAWVNTRLRT